MREEVLETLLVLLEIHHHALTLHGSVCDDCVVTFRKREAALLSKTEAIVEAMMAVVSLSHIHT
jgi:hypothetical protein